MGKEPEDDFDPRGFSTHSSDGTLDLVEGRDQISVSLCPSDSDDKDYDARHLGRLRHGQWDGAPVGLRS